MAEEGTEVAGNREEVALRLWLHLNRSYGGPKTVEGAMERFIQCRSAVLRGNYDSSRLG